MNNGIAGYASRSHIHKRSRREGFLIAEKVKGVKAATGCREISVVQVKS